VIHFVSSLVLLDWVKSRFVLKLKEQQFWIGPKLKLIGNTPDGGDPGWVPPAHDRAGKK